MKRYMLRCMKRAIPPHLIELQVEIVRRGLTQRALSKRCGVSTSDLSRILNGWLNHPEKLARIEKALLGKGKAVAA